MRIVGVGQMLNFQTGEVEDRIQVVTRIGTQFSVTTTNEGAALLVKMAMAARGDPQEESVEFPDDGAAVFGGDADEPSDEQVAVFQHTVETKAQRQATVSSGVPSMGIRKNPPDRSGVPSVGISRVDERGNPILPEAPEGLDEDDEEDDPGEQI